VGDVDVGELIVALTHLGDQASDGARAAARAMTEGSAERTRQTLELTSHPPGTATPSRPGSPPSRVSGHLQSTAQAREPFQIGDAVWEGHMAPDAVYARIQELGGRCGRGHATVLPARPYIAPSHALFLSSGEAELAAHAAFARAVGLI
jgi:hypothetical protein